MNRVDIAAIVEDQLKDLIFEAGWDIIPDGDKTEGDMTYCLDAAMRELGYSVTDEIRDTDINNVVTRTIFFMLTKLYNHFSLLVDTNMGPRQEKLSQVAAAIARRIRGMSGTDATLSGGFIEYDYPGTTFGAGGELSLADIE